MGADLDLERDAELLWETKVVINQLLVKDNVQRSPYVKGMLI
jgi:hypothetical protein